MKTIKLNKIENNRLDKKEMNHLCGGAGCGCGCHYAGQGGSLSGTNANANKAKGVHSPNSLYVWTDGVGWGASEVVVVRP